MTNILLDAWATTMWRACWQGGLVVVAVWSICRLIPSMPARFQCWFWRLAILKFMAVLVVPWFFNVPLLPAHRAQERIAEVTALAPTVEIQQEHLKQSSAMSIPIPILPAVLFLVWIIGVNWSLIRLLTAWRDARRLRRESCAIEDTSLSERLASQGQTFGIRRLPKLLEVPGLGSPMLVGVLRPVILMPAETLGRLDYSEQTMVLGHELAHNASY
jgi:beta-lactamase regulating signal transducer with metallopeptidase domain